MLWTFWVGLLVPIFLQVVATLVWLDQFGRAPMRHIAPNVSERLWQTIIFLLFAISWIILIYTNVRIYYDNVDEQEVLKDSLGKAESELEVRRKKERELEELKRTAPVINIQLRIHEEGFFYAEVESKNLVPIRLIWDLLLVKKDDHEQKEIDTVGIILNRQPDELHPTREKYIGLSYREKMIQLKNLSEQYNLEDYYMILRVKYVSLYFAQMQYPPELTGQQQHRYIWSEGGLKEAP